MGLSIRKAKKSDSASFLELVRALANFEKLEPPSPEAARRLIRDTFTNKKLNLLLAFSENKKKKAVAYALYFFTYSSFLARPTLYLEDIFVLEEYRRKKIGKALFLRLVKEAKRLGCGRMEWAVLSWNKNAIRFYEDVGANRLSEWLYYRLDEESINKLAKKF